MDEEVQVEETAQTEAVPVTDTNASVEQTEEKGGFRIPFISDKLDEAGAWVDEHKLQIQAGLTRGAEYAAAGAGIGTLAGGHTIIGMVVGFPVGFASGFTEKDQEIEAICRDAAAEAERQGLDGEIYDEAAYYQLTGYNRNHEKVNPSEAPTADLKDVGVDKRVEDARDMSFKLPKAITDFFGGLVDKFTEVLPEQLKEYAPYILGGAALIGGGLLLGGGGAGNLGSLAMIAAVGVAVYSVATDNELGQGIKKFFSDTFGGGKEAKADEAEVAEPEAHKETAQATQEEVTREEPVANAQNEAQREAAEDVSNDISKGMAAGFSSMNETKSTPLHDTENATSNTYEMTPELA